MTILIAMEEARSTVKYGERGRAYSLIEVGSVAQNIFLQAEALGLGAGIAGASGGLAKKLGLPLAHQPQVLMPVSTILHGDPASPKTK